jgi:CRP-like cAMP-binding protein
MREKYWYLKDCQLFEQLSSEVLAELESRSRMKRFRSGAPIYLPIDNSDGVLLVLSGQVKIFCLTPDGKQSIMTFISPGEVFGELALYQPGERGEHAEATMATEVVMIPAEAMRSVVESNPTLAIGLTRLVGFRRRRIEQRLKYLLFHSNRERLTHLLVELAEDFGSIGPDGEISLSIKLSHQDLASLIGSTRESVTVILGQMQAEGLLKLGRRKVIIRALDRLAKAVKIEVPLINNAKFMPVF